MVGARVGFDNSPSGGAREFVGRWWHSDHPDVSVGGTLRFDPEIGVELVLSGSLIEVIADVEHPGLDSRTVAGRVSPAIHGLSQDNEKITILRARFGGSATSSSSADGWKTHVYRQHWFAADVLIGGHTVGDELDRVMAVTIETRLLPGWALTERPEHREPSDISEPDVITIPRPRTLDVTVGDRFVALGWIHQTSPSQRREPVGLDVSMTPVWQIGCTSPTSLDILRKEVIEPLLRLATLATEKVDFVTSTMIANDDGRYRYELLTPRFEPVAGPEPDMDPYYFTIPYETLAERFSDLVAAWLSLYQEAPLALDDYFRGFEYRLTADERFIRTVRGLEQWHSRTQGGTELSPEQWSVTKSKIKAALEASEWLFVSTRLSHANNLSLRQRVLAVAEMAGYVGQHMSERLAQMIVRDRNGLTHGFNTESHRLSSNERWWATLTMRICMTGALLSLLGFTNEERAERLQESDVQHSLNQLNNPLSPGRLAHRDDN
jgi:hypothetical protein